MEVKVTIGFERRAESLLERLVGLLSGSVSIGPESVSKGPETIKGVEEITDTEMAGTATEEDEISTTKAVDYDALRIEAKQIGIRLVKKKKQKEVKALTSSFGFEAITEISDDKIESYIEELKKLEADA